MQLRNAIAVMGTLALFGCGGASPGTTPDSTDTGNPPDATGGTGSTGSADETGTDDDTGIPEPPPAECEGSDDSLIFQGASDNAGQLDGLRRLTLRGDMVYGCAEQGGLAGWNIADLLDPQLTTTDPAGAEASCSAVAVDDGGTRLVVSRDAGLELWGVDDPASPQMLSTVDAPAMADLVLTPDGTLFGAAAGGGVHALTITGDTLALVADTSDASSDARALAWSTSTGLWVAEGRAGLRGYVLDGTSLGMTGSVAIDGVAVDVSLAGDRAFVASLEGVSSVDVSDSSSPTVVTDRASPGTAMAVAALGDVVWISDWERLRAMDPTDGAGLALLGDEPLLADNPLPRTAEVVADDDRLIAAHWDGIRTYVPCPTQPPALWPELDHIDFRSVSAGSSETRVIVLRNNGAQPLEITSLATDHPAFAVPSDAITIAPGAGEAVEIEFAPTDATGVTSNLIVASNDPDEPEVLVPLTGNVPGALIGEPVVPFHAVAVDGRTWRPQDLEGQVILLAYFASW